VRQGGRKLAASGTNPRGVEGGNRLVKKILVADDDPPLRGLLHLVAARAGFEVDVASNGAEALEKIRGGAYSVAIIDLMMPRMSGYELIDRLAELPKRPAVIVVTALPEGAHARLNSAVVSSILQKPFEIGLLTAVLLELAATHERSDSGANVVDFPRSN
jgi:DNA-binding response OmpR family regulator